MQNRMMITGAGSGLGREIALRWAREGWQLALSDVSEPGLQDTLKRVREAGGDGFIQRCDVRDYSQLTAFAQACEVKLGGIDVIVNNAGVASGGFFAELSLEDWDWQIAINLMGVVKGCKAFLPLLEKSKGRIINIGLVPWAHTGDEGAGRQVVGEFADLGGGHCRLHLPACGAGRIHDPAP
jgi:NAD(P)-dependent dehydrogenase (short-subunit alcohol dehydrogenase family)